MDVASRRSIVGGKRVSDQSVSPACRRAPGEGLDGDGGLSDHEEHPSHRHHAVSLLDDDGGLGVAQPQDQSAAKKGKGDVQVQNIHF